MIKNILLNVISVFLGEGEKPIIKEKEKVKVKKEKTNLDKINKLIETINNSVLSKPSTRDVSVVDYGSGGRPWVFDSGSTEVKKRKKVDGESEMENRINKEAVELIGGKSYSGLRLLYSEAPGAVQCGNVIMRGILGNGFQIVSANEDEEVNEDDEEYKKLDRLIKKANKTETLRDVWESWITNYLTYGDAYLEKAFFESKSEKEKEGDETGLDVPDQKDMVEIYSLDSEYVKAIIDKELKAKGVEHLIGYSRSIPGVKGKIYYELDDLIHLKKPNPRGGVYGQAILENHSGILAMILSALTYNVNVFRNFGKGPLQIILPENTGEPEAEAFLAYYRKNYEGPENAGKTMINFAGAEAKSLGENAKDLDYLNLLNFGKKDVAGLFNVPLVMISDPEGSNRATSIEEKKGFQENVAQPERDKLLQKFNEGAVVNGLGVTKYKLAIIENNLEGTGKLTTEAKEAVMNGLATPNEAFAYSGWSTIDEEWANHKYIISGANIVLLSDDNLLNQKEDQNKEDDISDAEVSEEEDNSDNDENEGKDNEMDNEEMEEEKRKIKVAGLELNEIRKRIDKYFGYE